MNFDRLRPPQAAPAEPPEPWPLRLSAGAPGSVEAWLDGSIVNRSELASELGLPASTPPSQLVEAGWRRWGLSVLGRLEGTLALVVREGELVYLYRDPSSLRNLYARASADTLSVAPSLDLLRRQPGLGIRVSRSSLHQYLRFLDIAAPDTIYEHVRALRAGELLRWRTGAQALEALDWQSKPEPPQVSFDEALDKVHTLLRQAVMRRLDGSSRPSAFLSGGVDSALLCALAAPNRPDLQTLTVGFAGHGFDESPVAASIAGHLGLRHTVLRFERPAYVQALEQLGSGMDQPTADPATPATLLAFEHCTRYHDLVLDGTGADEIAGVMPPRHVRISVDYASRLPRAARASLARLLESSPTTTGYARILKFEHPADTMIRWGGFTRPEIERLCGDKVSFESTTFYQTFEQLRDASHFERYSALLNAMPCERLNQCERITGAPIRYPFCDNSVDRFVRSLPMAHLHREGEPKRLFRALLERHVPRELWHGPKHGFNFPLLDFLQAEGHALVQRHLARSTWRSRALLDDVEVERYGRRFISGETSLVFRVWALVILDHWLAGHGL